MIWVVSLGAAKVASMATSEKGLGEVARAGDLHWTISTFSPDPRGSVKPASDDSQH